MSTTLAAVLTSARAKVATIAPSRDATALFLEHTSNLPFEESAIAGADGFEFVAEEIAQSAGLGLYGKREWKAKLVLKLGHSPYDTDDDREEDRSNDVERLVDLLEAHAWPTGTMLVLHTSTDTDKTRANWWVTRVVFELIWYGDLRIA